MKFKIKINEMKQSPPEYSTYNFDGNGTYSALWANNISTYPDSTLFDIMVKYGFMNTIETLNEAHVTLVFSKDLIDCLQYSEVTDFLGKISDDGLEVKVEDISVFANPDGTHLVAKLEQHHDLVRVNNMFKSYGLSESFPDYTPHMTLFTTDEVIPVEEFNEIRNELRSYFVSRPIVFSRWNITNIAEKYVSKLK